MDHSDLEVEDQIILAAECVGRSIPIPPSIRTSLGTDLVESIENPESTNHAINTSKQDH